MEAAKVLEFPQETGREVSVLTEVVLAAREHGALRNREVAEWIVDNRPEFWGDMTRDERVSLLVRAVGMSGHRQGSISGERRSSLAGSWIAVESEDGSRESIMRLAATGKAVWDASWLVGETVKTTRELDETDIAVLVRGYERRRAELTARMRWLIALLKLMREHKVKVAGGLEKKGVELPTIEVEAGE